MSPLQLPRSCLTLGLSLCLESQVDLQSKFFDPILVSARFLFKYANTSSSFRSLALDVVSHFFTSTNCVSSFVRYQSLLTLIQKLRRFQSFAVSVTLPLRMTQPPRGLQIHSLQINTLLSFQDSTNTLEDQLVSLFDEITCSCVQHLAFSFNLSNSICKLITTKLPLLSSLTLFNIKLSNSVCVIPPVLNFLSCFSLESGLISVNSPFNMLSVSNLINLKSLVVMCPLHISLYGLSSLAKLKCLTLGNISRCDSLHGDASLSYAKFVKLSSSSCEEIFSNIGAFQNCELMMVNCDFDTNLGLTITPLIAELQSFNRGQASFSFTLSSNYTCLQRLHLSSDRDVTIDFAFVEPLQSLSLDFVSESPISLLVPHQLFILELTLAALDLNSTLLLLRNCPLIKSLKCSFMEFELYELITCPLNYLTKLQLRDTSGLYSCLPVLPRCVSLYLDNVSDFQVKSVNSKLPKLRYLTVLNCSFDGEISKLNNAITLMKVKYSPTICTDPLFLSPFHSLSHLSLDSPSVDTSIEPLVLPPNLKTIECATYYWFVKDTLMNTSSLEVISGQLTVREFEEEEANIWFSKLCSLRKDLKVSMILN
ncbi:hypothetical protein RCL1_000527 [Eukaryota sp. TZLM3-RCL]